MSPPSPAPRALEYVALALVSEDATYRLRHPGDVSALAQSIAQVGQLFPVEMRRRGEEYQLLTGHRRIAALRLLHRDRVLARVHEGLDDAGAAMIAAIDAIDARALEREDLSELRDRYRAMGWSTPAFEELLQRAIDQAEDRLEDLAARVAGRPAPDRRVVDEDALEEEAAAVLDEAPAAPPGDEQDTITERLAAPPADPPGAARLGRPRGGFPAQAAPAADLEAPAGSEVGTEVEVTVDELAEDVAYRLSEITQDLAALTDSWADVPELMRGIIIDQLRYYSELAEWLARRGEAP